MCNIEPYYQSVYGTTETYTCTVLYNDISIVLYIAYTTNHLCIFVSDILHKAVQLKSYFTKVMTSILKHGSINLNGKTCRPLGPRSVPDSGFAKSECFGMSSRCSETLPCPSLTLLETCSALRAKLRHLNLKVLKFGRRRFN